LRVRLTDSAGRTDMQRTFHFERDDADPQAIVEFDAAFGIHRLDLEAPAYGCSAQEYLDLIPGHVRSVTETLARTPPPAQMPLLLSGTAPQSFLYVAPTFVLFDKSAVSCGKPIVPPLPSHVVVENDQDAYYVWLYNDTPSRPLGSEQLALRLQTPTHQYHYVRIPLPFPQPTGPWPSSVTLNVTDNMIDSLAVEPVGTLLCPKLWETSAH
jgi:hypothetical protein